jgi:hypothetical protein
MSSAVPCPSNRCMRSEADRIWVHAGPTPPPTCFAVWAPERLGMPFIAQKGNPWALGCDDVATTRAELQAKGVTFTGEILDTGVCQMAFFTDPDGNELMLHHRYASYA